ncbi:hypothetical protein [Erythrobacter oryzae]|uniref:hypothetical protein n=1 Tax=Erythrobacter oryzae TaxID=3019556 RepID=UPI002556D9F1|nr:hypothetical protein [Erythrobacter sp. COR-2]
MTVQHSRICLAVALAALGACSSQSAPAVTDAEPGTYAYARDCFRAVGLQALTSGTGAPTAQAVMERAKAKAIAAGEKEGMDPAAVLTDILRATGEGARIFQSLSGSAKDEYAAASQAFAKTCLGS